jgi:NAD(P)-dependent dehydrogenase (short-subunit alcohol dehydrogenase family)
MIESKTVLITGAAGGIGRATVALFAEKGWHVIGVDRVTFGEGFPDDGLFIHSDISRPDDMESIFVQAHTFAKSLDAVVNNAAMQIAKPLVDTTVEEWDAVMASNLRSVFLVSSWHIRCQGKGRGRMSHRYTIQNVSEYFAYAASKGGMFALRAPWQSSLRPIISAPTPSSQVPWIRPCAAGLGAVSVTAIFRSGWKISHARRLAAR